MLHGCKKITERGLEALREVLVNGGAPSLKDMSVLVQLVESASLRAACDARNIEVSIH
jgi:hypothetical protein